MMFSKPLKTTILGLLGLTGSASAFTNPIRSPGAPDPQVSWSGGYYYFIATEWDDIKLTRATTIEGLKTAEPRTIYSDSDPSRCCNVWAPELHYLDGRWYIYYTAGSESDLANQRSHVLVGGATPWDSWSYGAQMAPDWGIDGTILRFSGYGNYFVYSCQTGVPNQSTCIRQLNSDNISTGSALGIISQPTESWERSEVPVQEGQNALYFGGRTYIAYSANYCWTPDYCVALLEWNGGDPMNAGSWSKSNGCSLTSANGNFGTGHNSFFQSPSGEETWITFHAASNSNGACDDSRYAMVQRVTANSDGTPNFGTAEGFGYEWPEPQ